MNKGETQQIIQESRYEYPYHYIPVWDGNTFSQTQTLAWGYEYLSYLYFVLDKVSQIGFESLLDVGCGDGRFLFELGRRFSSKRLAGIDYSQRAIDYARIMAPNVEWVCEDIRDENIFDVNFDLITLIETLEHIPPREIKTFLKGIHNYVADNGTFLITVPSKNVKVNKKHYQNFDLNTLTDIVSPFFTVVDVYYLNHKSSLSLQLIKKMLVNDFFILNNKKILKLIYTYYRDHLLFADIKSCRRIAVVCKKSP